MKKIIAFLLAALMLLSLCACGATPDPTSNPTTSTDKGTGTTGTSTPACQHNYETTITEATCTTDGMQLQRCTLCGHEQSETIPATGHSFLLGSCTVCAQADPDFRALTTGAWELRGVTEEGDALIIVTLEFHQDNTGFIAVSYAYRCTEEEAEEMIGWGNTVYEVDGKLYCASAFGDARDFNYTLDNAVLKCDLFDGFLYLVRETDEALSVLDSTDFVMDREATYVVKTIGAFTCKHTFDKTLTQEPTCQAAGIIQCVCSTCGHAQQEEVPARRHSYEEGVCSVCNFEVPYCSFDDGEWVLETLSEDGSTLYVTTVTFYGGEAYAYQVIMQEYYAEKPEDAWMVVAYEYNGTTYYGETWSEMWMMADIAADGDGVFDITITEKGGFTMEPLVRLTVERVSNNQFAITACEGMAHFFPIGAYLICY